MRRLGLSLPRLLWPRLLWPRLLWSVLVAGVFTLGLLAACSDVQPSAQYSSVAWWRPISSPNIMMAADDAQMKLEFDLRQCNCANFPKNFPVPAYTEFQVDEGRLPQTSIIGVGPHGSCENVPAEVLHECMRARGWEPALCSGRAPATPDGNGGGC